MTTIFKLSLIALLFSSVTAFSQDIAEQDPGIKGIERQIHYMASDDYFTFRNDVDRAIQIEHVVKNKIVSQNKIAVAGKFDRFDIEFSFQSGSDLVLYYSTVSSNVNFKLYQLKINEQCVASGEPLLLNELAVYNKVFGEEEIFIFTKSENNEFLCIQQKNTSTDPTKPNSYLYSIYDKQLNSITSGKFSDPISKSEFTFDNAYLSSTGQYYIGQKAITEKPSGDFTYKLSKIQGDEIKSVEWPNNGTRIRGMQFSESEQGKFICAGIYGEQNVVASGYFIDEINWENGQVSKEDLFPFSGLNVVQNWDSKNYKGFTHLNSSQPFDYKNLYFKIGKDGSVTAAFIQGYNLFIKGTTVINGTSSQQHDSRYVYYNDIFVFHLNSNLSDHWCKLLPYSAFQLSNQYFGGIGYFEGNKKFVLLMDDNSNCYDAAGKYIENSDTEKNAVIYITKNCVAKHSFELKSESVERTKVLPKTGKDNYILLVNGYYYDTEAHEIHFGMNCNGLKTGVIR